MTFSWKNCVSYKEKVMFLTKKAFLFHFKKKKYVSQNQK